MIFVNFKTHKEATGPKAVELIQKINKCQAKARLPVVPAVQIADARLCVNTSLYDIWVQHVDSIEPGQNTGWILPEAVAAQGVVGTFLNHSEHKYSNFSDLKKAIERCKSVGLYIMVFAKDLKELEEIVALKPNFVALEPPELIASQNTSVAKAKPDIIEKASKIAKKSGVPLIVGAGVKDSTDVKTSLKLGAAGVAVSSAVVLAKNPDEVLMELAKGF
ncbi:MAG: triose-phosphate isomerase [Candidatus Blackburnbacteria bacterium]|nr:triose-phosphate isomerase [Candidatus Blackburnbacteria bacterium]